LPHIGPVHRRSGPSADHDAVGAAQDPAYRHRANAEMGEQGGSLHLRNNTAELRHVADDFGRGDRIDAEHLAVEQSPGAAGGHPVGRGAIQGFHGRIQICGERRHGAGHAHPELVGQLMHGEFAHRSTLLAGEVCNPDRGGRRRSRLAPGFPRRR
jgi:hypothetical protein